MRNRIIDSARLGATHSGLVIAFAACLVLRPDFTAAAQEKKTETPPTHQVASGTLQAKVQLDGIFAAVKMDPVKIAPEEWTDLTIVEVVDHGTAVKKGEVLVGLDTEKIEEQIVNLERASVTSRLALELASAELENLNQTTPLKLTAAKRAKERADEDYAYFVETRRQAREKATKYSLKSAQQRLANAREELDQLEKMYEADDLTEETEEIILKRQQFAVEAAEYFLENAKETARRTLSTTIPREYEDLKSQKINQDLALELAEQSLPNALRQKEIALEKMKIDQVKEREKLADLKSDLALMTIRSPIDGLVYYGACERGKWTTGAAVTKKLIPGGKLTAKEIFMTVVSPQKLQIQTVVAEKDLAKIEEGLKGTAKPVSHPSRELAVQFEKINFIPRPGGTYPATLSVQIPKNLPIMPGMNCKISFEKETKSQGVLAPKTAVFTEGDQKFAYVWKPDGTPEKRSVKTGESSGKMVDVVEGLEQGEKILLKKPE